MEARTRPYVIIEGELYKYGVCSPLLKCLSRTEGQELKVYVDLILGLGLCWGRFSDKDFIGQRQFRMQQIWFKNVKLAKDVQETRNNLRL
jgi:hypothetical protein